MLIFIICFFGFLIPVTAIVEWIEKRINTNIKNTDFLVGKDVSEIHFGKIMQIKIMQRNSCK